MSRCPLATVLAAVLTCLPTVAQKPSDTKPAASAKQQYAAMVEKNSAPTEQHKLLAVFVGEFDQRTEVRMGPGEPMKFHSTGTGKWVMGGSFVQVDSSSASDEEVKGDRLLLYGYDPETKKYTLTNFETGSLTAVTATGDYDAATKTFTFDGERSQGGQKMPFRWTLKLLDGGVIAQTILLQFPGAKEMVPCVTVTHTQKGAKKK